MGNSPGSRTPLLLASTYTWPDSPPSCLNPVSRLRFDFGDAEGHRLVGTVAVQCVVATLVDLGRGVAGGSGEGHGVCAGPQGAEA